ncbi:Transcription initiation factor IIE, alpha subunit [Methanophagales archaeon]|nr:Transcription initiation factor IIE, alpha subunit [Methanophagales archaeon]
MGVTDGAIHLRDFPPFIRFELEGKFRRKVFAKFLKNVSEVEIGLPPEDFWSSAEEEFERSRYELVFGKVRGRILKTLEESPLSAKEIIKINPDLSPNSIYHAILWLRDQKHLKKGEGCWELKKDYFEHVKVSDLAKVINFRAKGERRRYGISIIELEMATFIWPSYERACDLEGVSFKNPSYGKYYQNHFALARAVKEWMKGDANIPQWALIAIAEFTHVDIEEKEVISSYCLPPGVEITPYYKRRYKLPIELSLELDTIALQILMKGSEEGLIYPVKHKKEIFKRLYHTFGSFQSGRIPLSIREIIEKYYQSPSCRRNAIRIPKKMKERWEQLPYQEKTLSKIRVLEMLFEPDQRKGNYELISRSIYFLEDVSSILKDLGIGDIKIIKRNDRPHYRSYLPKKVKENLEGLKEQLEIAKIEKGLGFLAEKDRIKLIRKVKSHWGDKGVNILSNLKLDKGVRDLDLARACGMLAREVRKILYELKDKAIIAYIREETLELLEYYYILNPDGIANFLAARKEVKEEKVEEAKYPFPGEFSIYQRRKLYSEVG